MPGGAPNAPTGDSRGVARTLVLNALRDVLADGPTVVTDGPSRDVIREASRAALGAADREAFLDAAGEGDVGGDDAAVLTEVADAVLDELVARDVRATVTHEASVSLPDREVALYDFTTSRDPAALAPLDLPARVREPVGSGAAALADGEFDVALDRFDDAVTAARTAGDGGIVARVLAGFAAHLAGDDDAALDYVEEALHLETQTWAPKLVGLAADHRFPEKFRTGKLGARVHLKWTADMPAGSEGTAAVGPADGSVEGSTASLDAESECLPVDTLWPESRVTVRLSGDLPDLPVLLGYYLAYGVVDLEVDESRSVEQVLLSGPDTAGAVETLRFRAPATDE